MSVVACASLSTRRHSSLSRACIGGKMIFFLILELPFKPFWFFTSVLGLGSGLDRSGTKCYFGLVVSKVDLAESGPIS